MNTAAAALIAGRTATTIRKWVRQERLVASVRRTDGPPGFALDITEEALAAAVAAQRRPGRPYKTAPVQPTWPMKGADNDKPR